MSETPMEAFGEEARIDSDQNSEIDPEGTDPKDVTEQFNADQDSEIDAAGDEPLEPGDLPSAGG